MQSALCIGVDVAKETVVVACAQATFPARTLPNKPAALKAFLRTLPPQSGIAMEATGGYHLRLADLAHQLGLRVYVLNPKDLYYYAKGVGVRAKTDRVDAALIARFLANEGPRLHPYEPATPEQRKIDVLLRRRAKIVALKTALQLTCADAPSIRAETANVLKSLAALISKIDLQLNALQQSMPKRSEQVERLKTMPGVGDLTACWLANLLDRVKFRNGDALVAFAGMDPRPCDSGQKRGRRRLSKRGPAEGRRLLFNAAMSAARTSAWKEVYTRFRERGWTSTEAILILARKMLRIALAMHKTQTSFDPDFIGQRT